MVTDNAEGIPSSVGEENCAEGMQNLVLEMEICDWEMRSGFLGLLFPTLLESEHLLDKKYHPEVNLSVIVIGGGNEGKILCVTLN
jgi:hypothetical protein